MNELNEIKRRYETRKSRIKPASDNAFYFSWYMQTERELLYAKILRHKFGNNRSELILMEIGAGTGDNIHFFARFGFTQKNIWANELLEDRFSKLQKNFPGINLDMGDALKLNYKNKFDIVFQSTVFTSILDSSFKQKLAEKMFEMTKPSGIILWYDFMFDNPNNNDVRGIGKKEIRSLFPGAKQIRFYKVTLAPPIGRRIKRLYNVVNTIFPFLRTHVIAVINK